jgi:hypothetical protein
MPAQPRSFHAGSTPSPIAAIRGPLQGLWMDGRQAAMPMDEYRQCVRTRAQRTPSALLRRAERRLIARGRIEPLDDQDRGSREGGWRPVIGRHELGVLGVTENVGSVAIYHWGMANREGAPAIDDRNGCRQGVALTPSMVWCKRLFSAAY